MENYNIEKHIRKTSKKNLLIYAIVLFFIVVFLFVTPFLKTIFPTTINSPDKIEDLYESGVRYVDFSFNDPCYFVGEYVSNDDIQGYYYFTMFEDKATFIIISDSKIKNRPDVLENYQGNAKLTNITLIDEKMFSDYAEILGWTPESLKDSSSYVFINELENDRLLYVSLIAFVSIILFYSLYKIISNLIYYKFTSLHPTCRKLKQFGSKQIQLKALSYELENGIVMIVNQIVITKSFLVEFSKYGLVIIPLVKIIRVYEHTNWHKIFWVKTKLSYTLNVIVPKFMMLSLKGNSKEEVETILDYLQTNYIDTKVGYCSVKYKNDDSSI